MMWLRTLFDMAIADVLIVYLAIGTPIGVFAIFRSKGTLKRNLAGLMATNVLFWPVFVSFLFNPSSTAGSADRTARSIVSDLELKFERQRRELNSSLKNTEDRKFRREALEAFDRLAGISTAIDLATDLSDISVPRLLEAVSHPSPKRAGICIYRRNLSRLRDHQERAFRDLTMVSGSMDITLTAIQGDSYV